MSKLLVICGVTATGKTDIAIKLARKLKGELVSCDSRQVYVGLDIGSGKLPSGRWKMEDRGWKKGKGFWEIDGVKVWMYDVCEPTEKYTVANYIKDAILVIGKISKAEKLPILVGGSGLYLKVLLTGLSNLGIKEDIELRQELENLSLEDVQRRLTRLSPTYFENLNPSEKGNKRRLIRAIELNLGQKSKTDGFSGISSDFSILKIGLNAEKEILAKRIHSRIISRINQGMIDEVRNLRSIGISSKRLKELGLEYKYISEFLEGKIESKEELIEILKLKIKHFAKRQMTWFKKDVDIHWFDISSLKFPTNLEKEVYEWYYKSK